MIRALEIYAGPRALARIQAQGGLFADDISVLPGAAGGPKGLILGPLDRYIFGHWLSRSRQAVDLVGASIGAWRLATACSAQDGAAVAKRMQDFEHAYIHQFVPIPAGRRMPSVDAITDNFYKGLNQFFAGETSRILSHPRYSLHIITARGKHILRSAPNKMGRGLVPLGFAGAFASNALRRRSLGLWLERIVFSSPVRSPEPMRAHPALLPFATDDYPTRQVLLTEHNALDAIAASCSIPFMLRPVRNIPGAPKGIYWDGGLTDYHLHLDYAQSAAPRPSLPSEGLVLYPHFQPSIIPGWLDKAFAKRHRASRFLDNMVLLCPSKEWIARLPRGKLPDRSDFSSYGNDLVSRVAAWSAATAAAEQLADEFHDWLLRPDLKRIRPLT